MFFGRYARMAEKVLRMLEECSAAVFEIYFDDKMKPYVELKRVFPDLREAEEYVEQHRYLDEEGKVLKPEEFLLFLKYAVGVRVWNYSSTTVLLLEY